MKYWEIIADNLHDAGWSLGWVASCGSQRADDLDCSLACATETVSLRADEKLTAFVELESAIRKNRIDTVFPRLPESQSR